MLTNFQENLVGIVWKNFDLNSIRRLDLTFDIRIRGNGRIFYINVRIGNCEIFTIEFLGKESSVLSNKISNILNNVTEISDF